MKTFIIRVIQVSFILLFFYSCKDRANLNLIYQTKVSYTDYMNKTKQIRFVKMHHIGKPEFYTNVVKTISLAKKEGYVLYYEWVDFDKATDVEKRKLRKLFGFIPSPEGYRMLIEQLGDTSLIVQDNKLFLNLENNKDFVVDLTPQEILDKYETKYGPLVLTEEDKHTPLTEFIEVKLPQKQIDDVLLHFRNEHLAKTIQESNYPKTVVLYGKAHEIGLYNLLKRLDSHWIKKKRLGILRLKKLIPRIF